MAAHFKDRTEYVLYEILNEPHGIEVNTWNSIQQKVIDEIRKVDQKHTIVVGGADWNSYRTLDGLPNYNDEKLIYTFHFYDPFLFTHQGASWVEPTMATLSNVPFPYDASRMPALPEGLKGSWVENNYNDYSTDGNVAKIHELSDIVVDFQKERNAAVFCGEFGVYIPNSPGIDRTYWYKVVRSYFEEKGIPWTTWDYTGGFGLFNQGGNDLFENDLNTDLTDALGFTAPPQTEFVMVPETESFSVYTDYIAQNIIHGNSGGEVDFYNLVRRNGDYGIHWTGGDQYNQLSFRFKPNKDLSQLVEEDFFVHFWARGDTPGTKFDLRFEDSHTELDGDLPWRIRSVIDESKMKFDRKWHEVIIPLSDFQEQGAWDGEWHDPIGAYDWQAVNKLEFSLEYSDLKEKNLWIDEIWVTNEILNYPDPVITQLNELKPSAIKVYPNPAREIIRIRLNENIPLTKEHIKVYDLMGHELKYELRRVSKNEVEIGLSQFSQKCLIVRIHGIDKVYTKKVIKR